MSKNNVTKNMQSLINAKACSIYSDKEIWRRNTESDNSYRLYGEGKEIIKLCPNGDIYVKGKLVENDKEVVQGMRELLGLV